MFNSTHTVVFDLDGTLVDTAPDLCHALNHVLERAGKPPMELEVMRQFVGRGARHMIEHSLLHAGVDTSVDDMDVMVGQYMDYYRANIAVESKAFPGVRELLETLEGQDVRLGVCTNKSEEPSHMLLEELGLKKFFPVILGSDSVPRYKPDPNHLFATIDELGGTYEKSVLVGDSPTDVATAKAAQIPVIAVDFGYTQTPPHEMGADHLISHYDELEGVLTGLIRNM